MPGDCRFCHTPLRHSFADLGMSPLSNRFLTPAQAKQPEKFYPLHAYVCAHCLLVQLEEFESPEEIFGDYAYFSSYSKCWLQHASKFVEEAIPKFNLGSHSRVIELASNDGYLLQYFIQKGVPVLGIEPAKNVAEIAVAKGVPTRCQFFGEKTARHLKTEGVSADLIVANNVLAHVPDINDFVTGIRILLKQEGVISLEFPHLLNLISENQFDTIYHEHFSYLTLAAVEKILSHNGLTVFDVVELSTHGGSLRVFATSCQNSHPINTQQLELIRSKERASNLDCLATYSQFEMQVRRTKREILEAMIKLKKELKSIVGYGAPAKGNTLLNYCGIGGDFIDYTVDLNQHKQGCYLPGTHIPVYPVDKVSETRPDYLLILPWNLKAEIIDQMKHIREWGGKFITLIPRIEVIH